MLAYKNGLGRVPRRITGGAALTATVPLSSSMVERRYYSDKYLESVKQRSSFPNQDTYQNLKLTSETRVIMQGFTGRQATFDAEHSIKYGTNIVGGVRPNKTGEHLGRPVLPNMREAMRELKPDATAVYVAAGAAAAAIEEAIESEIPLVVAVAEHIPVHEMLRIQQVLRTQKKTRLVGANTPGMINPHAKCRIGFPPIPFFKPGNIAIAAKSGTLSYETVASTTRAGLGQSMAIGIGGDPIPGTDFVDCLKVFEEDANTEAIILVGELGGFAEEHAAEWIKDYRKRASNPKPIAALIGGINAAPGRVMGHAGSHSNMGEPSAQEKIKHLEEAGVTITDHPSKFGELMKKLLANRQSGSSSASPTSIGGQRRSMHTLRRTISRSAPICSAASTKAVSHMQQQKRGIHLTTEQSLEQLSKHNVPVEPTDKLPSGTQQYSFAISLDRQDKNLRLVGWDSSNQIAAVPFNLSDEYTSGSEFCDLVNSFLARLHPEIADWAATGVADSIFAKLREIHRSIESNDLRFTIACTSSAATSSPTSASASSTWAVSDARVSLDDPAFKSARRHGELHEQRRVDLEDEAEVAAERDGIVYIKLEGGAEASIGTVANGAGLAMNLVDAIQARGGRCANFLDTGGKATSETVKMSFAAVLKDPRVKVVFVNIFGGLTLGDMIARGILLAYKELEIKLPVVVRLRGTNEKEGQKLIAESGLPMHAFDDFEEAAAKAIELAGQHK